MKRVTLRPFADPQAAARRLLELAAGVEPVQDSRIHIEKINAVRVHAAPQRLVKENGHDGVAFDYEVIGAQAGNADQDKLVRCRRCRAHSLGLHRTGPA